MVRSFTCCAPGCTRPPFTLAGLSRHERACPFLAAERERTSAGRAMLAARRKKDRAERISRVRARLGLRERHPKSMDANSDENCLFCKIIKGTIPSFQVYETEHTLAFLDISPVAEGHTQVIPKYHAKTIADLPDEYLADIGPAVRKVALATGVEQYNILQNNGKMAFQHVDHVHFHVIPKPNETEGLVINIQENWPQKEVTKEDLASTLEKMKARI